MQKLQVLPIDSIRPNIVALRSVNQESEAFLGLVDSIKNVGFKGTISVRPAVDKETNENFFEIVDGLHRYTAAKAAGLKELPCEIGEIGDYEMLSAQIMLNIHKVETKPAEYTAQLIRMMQINPLLTEAELARQLGKSAAWVKDRLSLGAIKNEKIMQLIDDGKIPLANAYALAKLDEPNQLDLLEQAQTEPHQMFVPRVHELVRQIRSANRKGKNPEKVFTPVRVLRKITEVTTALDGGSDVVDRLIAENKPANATEAMKLALAWCVNADPSSIAAQKAAYDEREAKRKADAEARKAEREAQKKAEADKAAAEVRAELK